MLISSQFSVTARARLRRQRGVVMIIALIVLVAMTLAAVGLVRSVDTNTVIAGNLAFQQAATYSADRGVEDAITWLAANNAGTLLHNDEPTRGYAANGNTFSPNAGVSWDSYWQTTLASRAFSLPDNGASRIDYVIDRLCDSAGAPTSGAVCVESPVVVSATGNAEEAGEVQLNSPSIVYYRITVRAAEAKNTVSYVQTIVSM